MEQFGSGGIKCDKKGCGYCDPDVKVSEYPSYINKPCPQCGSNLLTKADYEAFTAMMRVMNNPVVKTIDWVCSKLGIKPKTFEVDMDGSGTVKLKKTN